MITIAEINAQPRKVRLEEVSGVNMDADRPNERTASHRAGHSVSDPSFVNFDANGGVGTLNAGTSANRRS